MREWLTRFQHESGLVLHTGCHPRIYDAAEEPYRLSLAMSAIAIQGIDLTKAYTLMTTTRDPRPKVRNQGQKGSCAADTTCEIAEELDALAGLTPVELSGSDLYERDRKKEEPSNWTQDSGSALADNLDFAIAGLFSETDAPESDSLSENYDALTAGKTAYQYVKSHLPFYATESSDPLYFVKAIAKSIEQGYAVDLGMCWPQPWFQPDANGVLSAATPAQYQGAGGHSFRADAVLPILGGVVLCANHWTPSWNPQVTRSTTLARPGDFLVPFSAFTAGVNPYLEGRAVTPVGVAPDPKPSPTPAPVFKPDPYVVSGLSWQFQVAQYLKSVYPTGDVANSLKWQQVLANYAPGLASYIAGSTKSAPFLPERAPVHHAGIVQRVRELIEGDA